MRILTPTHSVPDLIQVGEVDQPDPQATDLFQRLFGCPPPDVPRHFIAKYLGLASATIGYVHFRLAPNAYLCGGMCFDSRLFRQMPADHRRRLAEAGGVAEILLRDCFADLTDRPAIFGYCGDTKAMNVDLRAGFERTDHPYLIVRWQQPLSAEAMRAQLQAAKALGPFRFAICNEFHCPSVPPG